jgi:transcriptional regulator with XRE-family HTH domain
MSEISVDFLSLVERGLNAPSFESLERIAKVLRLPVAQLFMFDAGANLARKVGRQ